MAILIVLGAVTCQQLFKHSSKIPQTTLSLNRSPAKTFPVRQVPLIDTYLQVQISPHNLILTPFPQPLQQDCKDVQILAEQRLPRQPPARNFNAGTGEGVKLPLKLAREGFPVLQIAPAGPNFDLCVVAVIHCRLRIFEPFCCWQLRG
jgi:hypothetical protein